MVLRATFMVSTLLTCTLALADADAGADKTPAASTADKPVVRAALGERSQAETAALERQLAATEQQQLQTQTGDTFLGLWRPANNADPSGAVILVPGEDESADWPIGISPLRHKLPDTGWSSLSLTLPDAEAAPMSRNSDKPTPSQTENPDGAAKPEIAETPAEPQEKPASPAEATADPAEDAEDTTVVTEQTGNAPAKNLQPYTERVFARIAAGITFAQQQGAKTVVLAGQGTGAYWAARYLAEQQPPNVSNLLLIAAQMPGGFNPDLETLISQLKLATGDFYYKDQVAETRAAKQRLNAAKRQKRTAYIQIAMTSLPGNRDVEQEQLFRRIKGWLSLHLQSNASAAKR